MTLAVHVKNNFHPVTLPIERLADEPYPFAIESIREHISYNPEFLRYLFISCYQGNTPLPESLQKKMSFIRGILLDPPITEFDKIINFLIATLPRESSNDLDFILTAIQNAPIHIRNEILQALPDAFLTMPDALTTTPLSLSKNPLFVQSLIYELPDVLREDAGYLLSFLEGASRALRDECEIEVLFSLIRNCSPNLSLDPNFLYSMVGILAKHYRDSAFFVRSFMMDAPEELRDNLYYLIAVIRHNPMAYFAVPEEYRANTNFVREIILHCPAALKTAPFILRLDQDFLISVLEIAIERNLINPNHFYALLCHADPSLQRDPIYIRSILELAPEEFRNNPAFIQTILESIPADIRGNCDFLYRLLDFSGPAGGG